MSSPGHDRMSTLLTQNHRKRRAAALINQWAGHGLAASTLSPDRYTALIGRLRGGKARLPQRTADLIGEMRDFVLSCDMVALIGWNVDEEPGLLVSAATFIDKLAATTSVYPDGFILFNDATGRALIVDLDEDEGVRTNLVDL